jgi:hypothetical protein
VDPLEWTSTSFHSVQGGEMAELRQDVGRGREKEEGLAESIINNMNFTTSQLHNFTTSQLHNFTTSQLHNFTTSQLHNFTTSQHQAPKFSTIAISQEDCIATSTTN